MIYDSRPFFQRGGYCCFFKQSENVWVNTELYLYGEITDAGGKNEPNIHLQRKNHEQILKIACDKKLLSSQTTNLLYKTSGIRVSAKQNLLTGELDLKSLKAIEIIKYDPTYNKNYLSSLVEEASPSWKGIDVDKWLQEQRGYDDNE